MTAPLSRSAFVVAGVMLAASTVLHPTRVRAQAGSALRVGISGLEEQAQALYADEIGYFKQAGLSVDVLIQRGGAATVAAVAGGALQLGCTNPISLGQALQRKLPFVMLAPAAIWDTKHPSAWAVVSPDAPIKTPKDLNGKVVGVGSLNGSSHLFMTAFIQQGGGDPSTVKFVEVPDGIVSEALAQGRISASILSEPMFSAVGNKVRSIGPPLDAIAPYFAQTLWFTTEDWLAQNKDTARRFIAAVIAAGKWAMANQVAAAGILEKRLGFKEPRAQVYYALTADPALLQVFLDRAAEYKMLPPMRAADFSWNGK